MTEEQLCGEDRKQDDVEYNEEQRRESLKALAQMDDTMSDMEEAVDE